MAKNTRSEGRTGLLETEEATDLFRSKFNAEIADIPDPVLDESANREADKSFLRSQRRVPVRRRGGSRFASRFGFGTRWFRLLTGILIVAGLSMVAMAGFAAKSFLLRNHHFILPSADNIQVNGNRVVTASQTLGFFAPDVGHSIFHIPLADRKAELEKIEWVRTATVMRLWPNQLHVTIVERTPVAFALDGNMVRLVDDQGILLDLPNAVAQHYSFPVLNGITAVDPVSIRAARVEMYLQFVAALDVEGGHISSTLSQVDLSDPEDIRAVFLGSAHQPQVHFGDSDYLARYQAYQAHLTEWLQQYPALRSVDMRYGKQVVLDTGSVPSGSSAPLDASSTADDATLRSDATTAKQSNETSTPPMNPAKAASNDAKRPTATQHGSKTHSHQSRHTPERGHTVRNPIMHVVSGM